YEFPLGGKVGVEDVTIPATAPEGGFEITWEALENPNTLHSRTHDFAFVAFARFPEEGERQPSALYVCNVDSAPEIDGSVTLTKEQLDSLPEVGIIQAGRLTHYMEEVDGKRFDMFAIWCAI